MAGGGDHADGGGGFSGGSGENDIENNGYNGLGGQLSNTVNSSGGGGYYTSAKGRFYSTSGIGKLGGQGGKWPYDGNNSGLGQFFNLAKAGDGGQAGAGGKIKYNDISKIYAYNGDTITNGDYSTKFYEYNLDGTKITNILEVLTKKDGTKFIQTKIFAQTGVIRETYTTNLNTSEISKIQTGSIPNLATGVGDAANVLATDRTNTETTIYGQGIGSGAGYLEKSNGTFESID